MKGITALELRLKIEREGSTPYTIAVAAGINTSPRINVADKTGAPRLALTNPRRSAETGHVFAPVAAAALADPKFLPGQFYNQVSGAPCSRLYLDGTHGTMHRCMCHAAGTVAHIGEAPSSGNASRVRILPFFVATKAKKHHQQSHQEIGGLPCTQLVLLGIASKCLIELSITLFLCFRRFLRHEPLIAEECLRLCASLTGKLLAGGRRLARP